MNTVKGFFKIDKAYVKINDDAHKKDLFYPSSSFAKPDLPYLVITW